MIGIYKITSPTGKIYIGQSVSVEKRIKGYKRLKCKKQPRLYNSLINHGYENHLFEIICECDLADLNKKERYYQDHFESTGKKGLNCQLTETKDLSGCHSEETKIKIGAKSKGRICSEATRLKISIANKGKIISEATRRKVSEATSNQSRESLLKKIASNTGQKRSQETKDKIGNTKKAIILNTETGIFYFGIQESADAICMKRSTLKAKLSGQNKNNTDFKYV